MNRYWILKANWSRDFGVLPAIVSLAEVLGIDPALFDRGDAIESGLFDAKGIALRIEDRGYSEKDGGIVVHLYLERGYYSRLHKKVDRLLGRLIKENTPDFLSVGEWFFFEEDEQDVA